MPSDDLERLVDRELKALPPPRAPRTLLPSLMAAVARLPHAATDARPPGAWYTRPFGTWPVVAKVAFAAVTLALVTLAARAFFPGLPDLAGAPAGGGSVRDSMAFAARAENATTAVWILWRVLLQPLVPYAFALAMLMCCACVVFGMALNYLVFGRTLHS